MNITVQQAQVITLSDPIVIETVRDFLTQKRIVAQVRGLPRPVILWNGPDEYTAAGNWTNDTALAQASAVLALSSIPWA